MGAVKGLLLDFSTEQITWQDVAFVAVFLGGMALIFWALGKFF